MQLAPCAWTSRDCDLSSTDFWWAKAQPCPGTFHFTKPPLGFYGLGFRVEEYKSEAHIPASTKRSNTNDTNTNKTNTTKKQKKKRNTPPPLPPPPPPT